MATLFGYHIPFTDREPEEEEAPTNTDRTESRSVLVGIQPPEEDECGIFGIRCFFSNTAKATGGFLSGILTKLIVLAIIILAGIFAVNAILNKQIGRVI